MIYGLGHDILEMRRIHMLLQGSNGPRFIVRILTKKEQAIYESKGKRQVEFAAGRFVAKEAISKAFGTGIGKYISFQHIEILPDQSGKPFVQLSKVAWQSLNLSSAEYRIHLSISHQPNIVSVQAIVERGSLDIN